jgi:hypothetical protein
VPEPSYFGESPLRIDGLYRRGGALSSGKPITYFLRFVADGSVQSAWIHGEERSGRNGETALDSRPAADRVEGSFELEGTTLSFATKSANGIVEYRGEIEADGSLVLDSHSHINGNREEGERFKFVKIEEGPRPLSKMIPRCIKLDCRKLRSGSVYEHGCGIRTNSSGWPLPGEGETVLGRWNVMGSRFFIDMKEDPQYGAYVTEGSLGILVTDKSLRGSFYEGKGPVGKLAIVRDILTFYWPYSLMGEPGVSHYKDDRRMHIMIEDPEHDGHLGLQGIRIPKGRNPDDFLSPILAAKNRAPEFHEQVWKAWESYRAAQQVGGAGEDPGRPAPLADRGAPEPEGGPGSGSPRDETAGGPETPAPTAVETNIGGMRFFDLSTVAETSPATPAGFKCESCGEAADAEDRFCSSCGQELIAH